MPKTLDEALATVVPTLAEFKKNPGAIAECFAHADRFKQIKEEIGQNERAQAICRGNLTILALTAGHTLTDEDLLLAFMSCLTIGIKVGMEMEKTEWPISQEPRSSKSKSSSPNSSSTGTPKNSRRKKEQ